MKLGNHYAILTYPFFHQISGKDRAARLCSMQPQWRLWWSRFAKPAPQHHSGANWDTSIGQALDDTYFFLPYVRQLLFPETTLLSPGDSVAQGAMLERHLSTPLKHIAEQLDPYSIMRLTYDQPYLHALQPLKLTYHRENSAGQTVEDFSSGVSLQWVDVALMPQQIGFLSLKVQIDEIDITVDRLNDFLYYVRRVHKPTIDWTLPRWEHLKEKGGYEFTSRDLVDFLLQGLTEIQYDPGARIPDLEVWLGKRDSVGRGSLTDRGQVYGETFRLYTYACFDDLPEAAEDPEPDRTKPSAPASGQATTQFASLMEQTLYELVTVTRTTDRDQDYLPHPVGLKRLMNKGGIRLWKNWEAMALHDNVVFLGARPTPFIRTALPHNVESDYFPLYLLTLYQKLRLSILSGEMMSGGDNLYENLRDARQVWGAFTIFRNHYWFAEVTFKPQGTELYKRFQQGLNVLALYESVNNGVRELQQYYERQADLENVEITKLLHQKTNEAVLAAKQIADRNLALTQIMKGNLEATNMLQADMSKQLKTVADIQIKVEWIEIFVVGFYAAELAHIIIALFEKQYELHLWWNITLVLAIAFTSGFIAWARLRPDLHHHDKAGAPSGPESGEAVSRNTSEVRRLDG